ncbi:unnamed protein product [Candidula unifasciata]|uniref:Uncharacterized protein n=1 Tax=Candidula unifasciata TaxID=100452 RepID=A0A8S3YC51_9EUPU|nr:unnamed protein product [Candidula unifasciata]
MLQMDAQCTCFVIVTLLILVFHSLSPVEASDDTKGHWGPWGPLSPCSVTCGSGIANMERVWIPGPDEQDAKSFKNPFTFTQVFSCTDETYPECPQNGTWSGWGAWSGCTKACGGGIRERHRECRGQMYGGRPCEGDKFGKEDCNREPCPPLPRGFDMSQCEEEANFTCSSQKMCIPISQKCDSTVQCHDGSDEDSCPSFSILWGNNIRYDLTRGRNGARSSYSSSVHHLFIYLVFAMSIMMMLH